MSTETRTEAEDKVRAIMKQWETATPQQRREAQALAILKFGKAMPMDSTRKNRMRRKNKKVRGGK